MPFRFADIRWRNFVGNAWGRGGHNKKPGILIALDRDASLKAMESHVFLVWKFQSNLNFMCMKMSEQYELSYLLSESQSKIIVFPFSDQQRHAEYPTRFSSWWHPESSSSDSVLPQLPSPTPAIEIPGRWILEHLFLGGWKFIQTAMQRLCQLCLVGLAFGQGAQDGAS